MIDWLDIWPLDLEEAKKFRRLDAWLRHARRMGLIKHPPKLSELIALKRRAVASGSVDIPNFGVVPAKQVIIHQNSSGDIESYTILAFDGRTVRAIVTYSYGCNWIVDHKIDPLLKIIP